MNPILAQTNLYGLLLDGSFVTGAVHLSESIIRLDDDAGPGDRIAVSAQAVGNLDLWVRNNHVYDLGDGSAARHAGILAEDDSLTLHADSNPVGVSLGQPATAELTANGRFELNGRKNVLAYFVYYSLG